MTDIFKVLSDPKSRSLLETIAQNPGLTSAKLEKITGTSSDALAKQLTNLAESKLLKATGSGSSKKYSISNKGFSPVFAWLYKVAEKQAVANLEIQMIQLGEKFGTVIATGTEWITKKAEESNIKVDPKRFAKELGKVLAEVKVELQKESKSVAERARKLTKKAKPKSTAKASSKSKAKPKSPSKSASKTSTKAKT